MLSNMLIFVDVYQCQFIDIVIDIYIFIIVDIVINILGKHTSLVTNAQNSKSPTLLNQCESQALFSMNK